MTSAGVLAYWFDLPREKVPEWAEWYIRDHMPSRVGATFSGARCFRAVKGTPEYVALYTTETVEALLAPDYLALLSQVSPDDRRRRAFYTNTIRATCRVRASFGHGQGGIVGTIRVASRSGEPRLGERIIADIAPQLARSERIGAVQVLEMDRSVRARMDAARVTGHDDGLLDWVVCVEGAREEDFSAAIDSLDGLPAWRELADEGSTDIGCYRMLYAVARE